ncbi:hypothetical protein RH915_06265 [Serpentinicella sp. ANB-PHB4]|uniref:hypothetical protein n=1 Tax=Serpentinicella sp. ANB-PHB4 TaxID=3074076 RepID=UPI0028655629|nr:hypothetical protein [Serpentinicella sp. ANB-PHB4]MDR5659089.1 hypothetical protein [Serpentinicella sp. ANB-PHB4]
MITVFNRKEVYNGYALKKFSQAQNILNTNSIKYKYKVVNHCDSNSFIGLGIPMISTSSAENQDYSRMYYIYVHKTDYEKARKLLEVIL